MHRTSSSAPLQGLDSLAARSDDGDRRRGRIQALSASTAPRVLRAVDALLQTAQDDLIPAGAHLEPAAERASAVDVDHERFVLMALMKDRVVGVVDAQLAWPTPHHLLIRQIAVAPRWRHRGIARALIDASTRRALVRSLPLTHLYARTRPGRDDARSFWRHLGCSEVSRHTFELELHGPRRKDPQP